MGTKHYINYTTQETVSVPNVTEFSHRRMLQNGFREVSEKEIDNYVKEHFND